MERKNRSERGEGNNSKGSWKDVKTMSSGFYVK